MQKLTKHLQSTQQEKANPRQVKNNAGGYVYQISCWEQFRRFLILGSEGGTYYASERKLTRENARNVLECLEQDAKKTLSIIENVSINGRAPKNDPAIFALALSSQYCTEEFQKAFPKVIRTGMHLFTFAEYINSLRGWGRSIRYALENWYNQFTPQELAYQFLKYRQREGWSQLDVLRKAHPTPKDEATDNLFKYITKKVSIEELPNSIQWDLIRDFAELQKETNVKKVVKLLETNKNLSWEMIPTQFLKEPSVWKTLLPKMPLTALIRNLGRMTAIKAIKPLSKEVDIVMEKLNREYIAKSRLHPLSILIALKTYAQGHGEKGSLQWNPIDQINNALEEAYYLAFKSVEPTGKRFLIGLDVSGSMTSRIDNYPLSVREAAAALCMTTVRTENKTHTMAFSHGITPFPLTSKISLDGVVQKMNGMSFSTTDCALPMIYAIQNEIEVDVFVIYTDNETWTGKIHPDQALKDYRKKTGINAKLIVVGMTSTGFSIADPNDAGMLDVVGFDTNIPTIMREFITEGFKDE